MGDRDFADNRAAAQLTADNGLHARIPSSKGTSGDQYRSHVNNVYQPPGPRVTPANLPRPVTETVPSLPTNRSGPTPYSSHGQPATYRLISAALNNPTNSNSQPVVDNRKPPVPAQRSQRLLRTTSSEPFNHNTAVKVETAQPVPFAQYQKSQMLYSESHRLPPRHTALQKPGNYRESTNIAIGTSGQPASNANTREPLPSYDEVRDHRNTIVTTNRTPLPPKVPTSNSNAQIPTPRARQLQPDVRAATLDTQQTLSKDKLAINVPLVAQNGESCCGSSNPDSGYGGHNYEFYSSQPSPQQPQSSGTAQSKEYESWYSRRLQDAARKISTYSGLRPQRTMTSDV